MSHPKEKFKEAWRLIRAGSHETKDRILSSTIRKAEEAGSLIKTNGNKAGTIIRANSQRAQRTLAQKVENVRRGIEQKKNRYRPMEHELGSSISITDSLISELSITDSEANDLGWIHEDMMARDRQIESPCDDETKTNGNPTGDHESSTADCGPANGVDWVSTGFSNSGPLDSTLVDHGDFPLTTKDTIMTDAPNKGDCYNSAGVNMGIRMGPCDESKLQAHIANLPRSLVRDDDLLYNRRFYIASWKAYKKLFSAARQPSSSPQLNSFVSSLGSLTDIIRVGFDTLDSILAGNNPSNLQNVYCFLHVAYAMSRAERKAKDKDLPSTVFQEDLHAFRQCLSRQTGAPDQLSEQDIFDEIAGIMWNEFQRGLAYLQRNFPEALLSAPHFHHEHSKLSSLETALNVENLANQETSPDIEMQEGISFTGDDNLIVLDEATDPKSVHSVDHAGGSTFWSVFFTTIVQDVIRIAHSESHRFPLVSKLY
ncbi:hypothetical protein ABW21_db0206756 [Orbilia brochopaga]|nr:hypothetical protein ABW21_db0206756 [Drechslerella brochopaga]